MRKIVGSVVIAAALIFALVAVIVCTTRVPAGYVGVVYNMNGGIEGNTLSQGWHLVAPTKKVTIYTIGLEQSYLTSEDKGDSPSDESFKAPTSDGKTVKVELEFSYRFDADRVAETFVNFKGKNGESIKNTFIKPKVSAWTQEITALYPVTDIFGDKRTEINAHLDTYLRDKFDQYGILIDTVNFTNIEVDADTAAAIQKKVNAQQERELAQIEASTAQINAEKEKEVARIAAEKEREVAQIKAESARIEAESKAQVTAITAEAEARANAEIAASLTPELIEKIKMERWDGVLPQVTNGTPILNID